MKASKTTTELMSTTETALENEWVKFYLEDNNNIRRVSDFGLLLPYRARRLVI